MTSRRRVLGFIWFLFLTAALNVKAQAPSISPERLKARKELGLLSVEYSKESFVKQASEGDTIAVQLFIAAGMDPNVKGGEALIAASGAGHIETVRALIAAGADVNADNDVTALISATRLDVVKYLLDHGADVNAKDKSGNTALMRAAGAPDLDRMKVLIDRGADVDARGYLGRTALLVVADVASQKALADAAIKTKQTDRSRVGLPDYLAAMKILLAAKADVNARDDKGYTALLFAARWKADGVAQVLLDHGANVNEKADDGFTPLLAAVLNQSAEMVKSLLAKGADPNTTANEGSVLKFALQSRNSAIAQLLINAGAKQ
ncbi:MAG TPA: ankyrin repeat domain-containing protein [Blastocatellia bacterium]|nr:ankyrin repeat domain-containing protein [Blastocatellia bacterium]